MPYRTADLEKNTFPLVFETPTTKFLDKEWRTWREDRSTNPTRWEECLMLYDFNHVNPNNALAMRSCTTCNLGFTTEGYRMMHLKSYEHQVARAKKLGLTIPEDPLLCKLCNFRAYSDRKMESHKRTWEHEKNLAVANGITPPTNDRYCDVCNVELQTLQGYKKHLTGECHLRKIDKGLYNCKICDRSFASRQALNTHYGSKKHKTLAGLCVVAKKPNFECTACNTSYASKQSLQTHRNSNKHMRKHILVAVEHKCEVCEKTYKNRRQLLKHRRTKHPIILVV